MDSVKIISHVKNYQTIGNESLVDISELKKKYPWFGTLHTLEAKCLKNENKFGLKKSIKTASLFTGDREVLYDFIHDDIQVGSSIVEKSVPATKEVTAPKVESEVHIKPEEPKAESKPEVPKTIVPPPIVKVIEKETEKETPPPTTETKTVDEPIKVTTPPAKDDVEEPKITPKPAVIYDPLIELQSKLPDSIDKPKKTKPIKVYDPLVELPKLEVKQVEKKTDKQDFYSWLDSLDEEEVIEEPKPRKLKMSAEASQLLENFIKNRPNISRIRTDVERTEIHKESSENSQFELVTESLALLHVKQGRPEKAIEIYQKLRLQNPQKFSYFAALIEKTKQEHNIQ